MQFIVELEYEDFMFEYEVIDNFRVEGICYSGTNEHLENGSTIWLYEGSENGARYDNKNENSNIVLKFSFCYRGVWEGRIYFEQEEYWSEDLFIIS